METKPGAKTTEFWLALLAVILPFINQVTGSKIPVDSTVAAIGTLLTVVAYIASRTIVKKAAINATDLAATIPPTPIPIHQYKFRH